MTLEEEEQDLVEAEAHYHAVLADMAELMMIHGTEAVVMDLMDISIRLIEIGPTDSSSIN